MSILSPAPDQLGFFYGFKPGDYRQINVRQEPVQPAPNFAWFAYVGGDRIEGRWATKEDAEAAALKWMEANTD